MTRTVFRVVLVFVLGTAMSAIAVENKGAEQITLDGGSRGSVVFPHHRHQNRLNDCNVCHVVFAQTSGVVAQLKRSGQLTPKQVMNKLCIKCHKSEKQAGNPSGPVTCSKCHQRG